jgi:hypothetical protein
MDTTRFRKSFAILGALFTGGLSIGLISVVPETVEAAFALK